MTTDACGVTENAPGDQPISYVGPPYQPGDEVPAELKMILALIDGSKWPLQVEGDTGIGVNASAWGGVNITECDTIEKLDDGPLPNGPFPAVPAIYPGVGVTAYGCQLGCNYIISGDVGSSVIVGKIDGQWHILRVLGSASTVPLTGPSNECRCCGNSLKDVKLRARILTVTPDGCGDYRACDEFLLDPLSTALGNNPMGLSLTCQSTEGSLLEDINDWTAYAFGNEVTVVSINCCNFYPISECGIVIGGGIEACDCDQEGSETSATCRFEAVIEFTHGGCAYRILIWFDPLDDDDDPCTSRPDEPIDEVIASANGIPTLQAGDRVIMAKIPGGIAGRTALDGTTPVEWFIIRACTDEDCSYPCNPPPPPGPPCCGKACSEMPNSLSATIEIISSDCCSGSTGVTLNKEGADNECDGAANTKWFAHDLTDPTPPEIIICTGTAAGFPPYPTKVAITNLELICGSAAEDESCGDPETDPQTLGPLISLSVSYYTNYNGTGDQTTTLATQDRVVSCCSPLYLEYTITIPVCFIAGAGTITATTTLKITISE